MDTGYVKTSTSASCDVWIKPCNCLGWNTRAKGEDGWPHCKHCGMRWGKVVTKMSETEHSTTISQTIVYKEPNERSKQAIEQTERGALNEYEDVDDLKESINLKTD